MKIYFDGCSWTQGAELENPEEERYSRLICDKLGAEETNLSIVGGSNDRIVRNLLYENTIVSYDLAIIQMTFPTRTEYWDDKWIKVSAKHNYNRWLYGENGDIRRIAEKFSDHNQFWKYYYTNVASEELFRVKENIHKQTITNHCKVNDVPLILCSINTWSKLHFDYMMKVNSETRAEKGHPNRLGHQKIAENVIKLVPRGVF